MKEAKKYSVPLYARFLVRFTRPFPNFDFSFIKPLRQKAADLLQLKEGDRVLDAGCGAGGSFQFLRNKVGSSGEVVGIEISPETVINTLKRIDENKWANVHVILDAAQKVALTGAFDGLLMFAAPDIYASEQSLQNILPHVKDQARVVIFGAKITSHRIGRMMNPLLRMVFKRLSPKTPEFGHEPWNVLKKYAPDLVTNDYFFGLMFLASGSISIKPLVK